MIRKNKIECKQGLLEDISRTNVMLFNFMIDEVKKDETGKSGRVFGINNEDAVNHIKKIKEEDKQKILEFVSKISIPLFLPSFRLEIMSSRFGCSTIKDKDDYFSFINTNIKEELEQEKVSESNYKFISLLRDVAKQSKIICSMLFKTTENESEFISKITPEDMLKIKKHGIPLFEIGTLIHKDSDSKIIQSIIECDTFHTNLLLRKSAMRMKKQGEIKDLSEGIVFSGRELSEGENQYNYSVSFILGKWLSEEDMHPYNIGAILPRISRSNKKKLTNKKGNKPRGSSWIMNSNNDRIIANIILGLTHGLNKTPPKTRDIDADFRRFGEEHVIRMIQINEGYDLFISGLIQCEIDKERYIPQSSNGKKINSERIHFLLNGIEDKDIYEIKCDDCGTKAFIHHKNPRAHECPFCHKQHEYNTIE